LNRAPYITTNSNNGPLELFAALALVYTLKKRYITEPVSGGRTFKVSCGCTKLKKDLKRVSKILLGFVDPYETLKVLPLDTGSVIYLFFRV
jgi:hypothetical protein